MYLYPLPIDSIDTDCPRLPDLRYYLPVGLPVVVTFNYPR